MQGYVYAKVHRHNVSRHLENRISLLAGFDADSARRRMERDAHRGVLVRG